MTNRPKTRAESRQEVRYARQLALHGFGLKGQERISRSRVLIIGLGGLGSPAALYLAAAGVGQLQICDFDRVDLSNLQRQILYTTAQLGIEKTQAAVQTLSALNPEVEVAAIDHRLNEHELINITECVDAVLDASDNFGTRFAVNRACVRTKTPLVSGAAIRFEGQLAVFRNDQPAGPCYRCLFAESQEASEDCRGNGILGPVAGVIGCSMAIETLKLLALDDKLTTQLLRYDALTSKWSRSKVAKDPRCPVCGVDE